MKKAQLKVLLKPIVKECINEALIEQGLLSNIIAEVVKGLGSAQTIVEAKAPAAPRTSKKEIERQRLEALEEQQRTLKEQKRKLLDAAGFSADIFEGTEPLPSGGNPNASQTSQAGALSGMDPKDAGIDISGIMKLGGRDWSKMI